MGLSVQLTALTFILASTHHPTEGGGHDPLLVLDGYEDGGIRLKCFSERLFSEVQIQWTDGRGDNVTGTPLTTGTATANASSSIVLKAGSGNSASCKIIDKLLKTSTESSVVIADAFFPATSPWLAAFLVILLLNVFLVIAAIYKLRKINKTTIREKNAETEIRKEEEKERSSKENQDLLPKIDKLRKELEFRRAQSRAVNITLDENCKHPSLIIKDKNRVKSSTQEEVLPKAMVAATEGFSEEKHYWEVEVGDKAEWELGVVLEELRNTLRNDKMNTSPKEKSLSLSFSQGQYSLSDGGSVEYCKPCRVLGVLLDQDLDQLSFFDVEEKCLLTAQSLEFSGKLHPFFSPGSDGEWLGVRPVNVGS
ncbi:butyrophilin subfamily 2 member A1-like [Porphyrio hochstetteri]